MKPNLAVRVAFFLLRVVSGLLLLQAGGMKLFEWFGGVPAEMGGPPKLMSQIGVGAVLEVVGGALVLLGLFTRPAAFVLSGTMAVAYFQFHQPSGFWPIQNHGEPAVLLCFIYLFVAAYGGGEWSFDAMRRKSRAP